MFKTVFIIVVVIVTVSLIKEIIEPIIQIFIAELTYTIASLLIINFTSIKIHLRQSSPCMNSVHLLFYIHSSSVLKR